MIQNHVDQNMLQLNNAILKIYPDLREDLVVPACLYTSATLKNLRELDYEIYLSTISILNYTEPKFRDARKINFIIAYVNWRYSRIFCGCCDEFNF